MTNTTNAPLTFQTAASFALGSAELTLADAKAKMVDALADPAYALQWNSEKLVKAHYRVQALSYGVLKGVDAMTSLLADTVSDASTSTSQFATAIDTAQRVEALQLISEFRSYLDAGMLLDRL